MWSNCRLLRSFSDFKKRVERDPSDEATAIYLAELVRAITGNVSVIKERKHETLVAEILAVKLWTVPKVSGRRMCVYVCTALLQCLCIHSCLRPTPHYKMSTLSSKSIIGAWPACCRERLAVLPRDGAKP